MSSSKEKKETVVIIGAGYAGLSAACLLAKNGYHVIVIDKNDQIGGRATIWEQDGFTFDLGPSWYWMPEVFEEFFSLFGKKISDYYSLKRLDPPYKIFFAKDEISLPDKLAELKKFFESREPGAAKKLEQFLAEAEYKYRIGMTDYVWRPSISFTEFLDPRLAIEAIRLQMLTSQRAHVQQYFKDELLVKIMEWPVLFLGGSPSKVPALYSLMDYAAIVLGTFYPEGGMSAPAKAMAQLAKELGVEFQLEVTANRINIAPWGRATSVETSRGTIKADIVVAAADYHHVEQQLLEPKFRTYDEKYWDSRVMSPGSLLFFLGVSKRLKNLEHHNLFFDEELDEHSKEIYDEPKWPKKPLFYVCVTSISDPKVAPDGMENVFVLIPLAAGLEDTEEMRQKYYHIVMDRLEKRIGENVRDHVKVFRSFAHKDFESRYNSYKGNAYGLANTLLQTAILKPSIKPGKVPNLYFAGQLTSPGPGVPPAIISGQVVAKLIEQDKPARFGKSTFPLRQLLFPLLLVLLAFALSYLR